MLGTQSPSLRLEVIFRTVDVVVCVDPHLVLSCAPRRKHRERARHTESNEHLRVCEGEGGYWVSISISGELASKILLFYWFDQSVTGFALTVCYSQSFINQ